MRTPTATQPPPTFHPAATDSRSWDRAAIALAATTLSGERHPRTISARGRLAAWLDGGGSIRPRDFERDCAWLEGVARAGRITERRLRKAVAS